MQLKTIVRHYLQEWKTFNNKKFMWWMIIGIPAGFLMLRYYRKIGDFVGSIAFAEKYLGAGGTYSFIRILAIFIIIFCFAYPIGGCDGFFSRFDALNGK